MATKTTTVYICDRCGKEFEEKSYLRNLSFVTDRFMKTADDERLPTVQKGNLTMDLCLPCSDDFVEWWDRGDGDTKFED